MKKRRHVGLFLLLVSMLVLIVPVLPHHHHYGDDICFHDDDHGMTSHHQSDPDCEGYCITNLHFSVQHHNNTITQPHYFHVVTLFSKALLQSLLPPNLEVFDRLFYYIESLHGAGVSRTISLRAPPAI